MLQILFLWLIDLLLLKVLRFQTSNNNNEVALFSMNSHKAPGIDGYNAHFFKNGWSVIGAEVIGAIKDFFRTGYLSCTLNSTLIALLPKKENACSMKEYIPIACCTLLYKIISKVFK